MPCHSPCQLPTTNMLVSSTSRAGSTTWGGVLVENSNWAVLQAASETQAAPQKASLALERSSFWPEVLAAWLLSRNSCTEIWYPRLEKGQDRPTGAKSHRPWKSHKTAFQVKNFMLTEKLAYEEVISAILGNSSLRCTYFSFRNLSLLIFFVQWTRMIIF